MGVQKTILQEGSGASPKNGDKVTMEYTGWLKDPSQPNGKGKQYVFDPQLQWYGVNVG